MKHARTDYNENIQEVGPILLALVAHLTTMDEPITVGGEAETPPILEEVMRWANERGLAFGPVETHFGEDEPVFILRARDELAPEAVRSWADNLTMEGGDPETVSAVMDWADHMETWAEVHGPPKLPDTPSGLLDVERP